MFDDLIRLDRLGFLEDLVGNAFGCGSAVRDIILDTEIVVRASGVVRGSEKDATVCLVFTNDVGGSRGRKDGVLADDEFGDTIGRADLQDGLDGLR